MAKTSRLPIPNEVAGTPFEKEYLATAERILQEQVVLRLYREHKISTGTGAKLLGMSIYDFIQFLGSHQVSIFNLTESELAADIEAGMKAVQPNLQQRKKKS